VERCVERNAADDRGVSGKLGTIGVDNITAGRSWRFGPGRSSRPRAVAFLLIASTELESPQLCIQRARGVIATPVHLFSTTDGETAIRCCGSNALLYSPVGINVIFAGTPWPLIALRRKPLAAFTFEFRRESISDSHVSTAAPHSYIAEMPHEASNHKRDR
jgi:hypothetical protein